MPTARARYRRRPVFDQITRGMVERDNPGFGDAPGPDAGSGLLLTDGTSFLLLTDNSFLLLAN